MEVVFLGFGDYCFDTRDGNRVDGVKFFYYFDSSKSNYFGFESAGIFISRSRSDLIDKIKHCTPGSSYKLVMGYDGRKAQFADIIPV